jgi:hypothetical protein
MSESGDNLGQANLGALATDAAPNPNAQLQVDVSMNRRLDLWILVGLACH